MALYLARRAAILGIASLVMTTTASAGLFSLKPPSDIDLSLRKRTEAGLYTAVLAPLTNPIKIGSMHTWTVTLIDARGRPVDKAEIAIGGGMPQHGHGLPTAPAVTQRLGDGRHLIEGMKFNMHGWWEIDLGISGPAGSDIVTFNLVL